MTRRARVARCAAIALALLAPCGVGAEAGIGAEPDAIGRGDLAWAQRGEGRREGRPTRERIDAAIEAYARALAADPDRLEARWKLLRALHFAGEFVETERDARREVFERATDAAEEGRERLARSHGDGRPLDRLDADALASLIAASDLDGRNVARFYFWAAIDWGAWSRSAGLLAAVRQGVANRLHAYVRVTLALEPDYEEGGAHRLLGRLHAELPRVPLVSGWVDRDRALPQLERAFAVAPQNPGNRLLLALTLLDLAPERRDEALALLADVASLEPRPDMQVEDEAMRRAARERLAAETAAQAPGASAGTNASSRSRAARASRRAPRTRGPSRFVRSPGSAAWS